MDQYSSTLWEYFSSSHGAIIHDHRHKTSNHWPTEHVLIGSVNALKQPTAPVPYIITSSCGYLFVVDTARVRVLFPTSSFEALLNAPWYKTQPFLWISSVSFSKGQCHSYHCVSTPSSCLYSLLLETHRTAPLLLDIVIGYLEKKGKWKTKERGGCFIKATRYIFHCVIFVKHV